MLTSTTNNLSDCTYSDKSTSYGFDYLSTVRCYVLNINQLNLKHNSHKGLLPSSWWFYHLKFVSNPKQLTAHAS